MTQVRWTRQALDDLLSIREFIARDSPTYARHVVERLYEAAGQLADFPDSGRILPERGDPTIREVLRPPYRIVYRREPNAVVILTVHHTSRLFPGEGESGQATD